jgi:hypothetical protein
MGLLAAFCAVRWTGRRASDKTAAARSIFFIGEVALYIGSRLRELKLSDVYSICQYMTIKSFIDN